MNLSKVLDGLSSRPRFDFFTFSDINPQSGRRKQRTVAAPNKEMKLLQRRLLIALRADGGTEVRQRILRYATSSNPGDSPLKNVRQHRHSRFFYLLDFSNAYGSVAPEKLAEVMQRLPAFKDISGEELVTFLKRYFFDKRCGLVPGGPASQDLFNLYAGSVIDLPIAAVLKEIGAIYTRYIDDLTISTAQEPLSTSTRRAIRNVIVAAGFQINHRKCELVDLKKRTVVVTGIGLAADGRIFAPRPYVSQVRGLIHRALTKHDVDKERVVGMILALKHLLQVQSPNRLEQKVLRECDQFLARI